MDELGLGVPDLLHALRTCRKVSGEFAQWPCSVYHGETLDDVAIAVAAVIHETRIKLINVWKE